MSYGDGGFWFTQPMGQKETGFQPSYGRLEDGKKIGKYQTIYQPSNAYSSEEKDVDIRAMTALKSRLKADLLLARQQIEIRTDKVAYLKSSLSGWSLTEAAKERRAKREVDLAKWEAGLAASLRWEGRIGKALNFTEQAIRDAKNRGVVDEPPRSVSTTGWEGGEGSPEDFIRTVSAVSLDAPMVAPMDAPMDAPMPDTSFYEDHKGTIVAVGGLVGAFALYRMVRK